MLRRTKIVCTLGPASSSRETIREMVRAGMDVARLNFSHGTHDDHAANIRHVREAERAEGRSVALLQDLQGPKIRIGEVADGSVLVHQGRELVLTTEELDGAGTAERVHIDHATLPRDVNAGGRVLIDDGMLELKVLDTGETEVRTEVVVGGPMRSRKGVNLPHVRTTTPSLTEKDVADLEFGLEQNVDLVALSFVRSGDDVSHLARRVRERSDRVREQSKSVSLVAKIEKPEAVDSIDGILEEADGLMVARGDMGVELPLAEVPSTQKMLIHKSMASARPVITATQMLESMIENPRPTRAEASDVANAVLDGSDAVMLSGETAVGEHPVRVVEVMSEIVEKADRYRSESPRASLQAVPEETDGTYHDAGAERGTTESISFTACQVAEQVGATAIACLTNSGRTACAIARHRPDIPVYAFTNRERVVDRLGILWGTRAFAIPFQDDTDQGVELVHDKLTERGLVESGDLIVLTAGMPLPRRGRTNMIHVSRVAA
ncbi:MAG: pyruvate kinase [Bacteroidetes bacterium QS_9_68_14]|nr:MAG: pyruvate kinase [Bacteroidetes bacterium QS_9_68_14]